VDGTSRVLPLTNGETIRYLGAMINLNLDWRAHVLKMNRAVQLMCNNIRRYRFNIPEAVYSVQQQLVPQLRLGFVVARVGMRGGIACFAGLCSAEAGSLWVTRP
jgi:hypothetical protein